MSKTILLPHEADFTDEEFELIERVLDKHFDLVTSALYKVRHLRREDDKSPELLEGEDA